MLASDQTAWREPDRLAIGDTLEFERALPDYPAGGGWSLLYEIRGNAQTTSITSQADGDNHYVHAAPAVTASWIAGDCVLVGFATNGTDRFQIYYGRLTLTPNYPASDQSIPVLTFAQKMIAQLESVMLAKAGDDIASSQVGESRFQFLTPEQLQLAHGYWTSKRLNEIAKENARNGKPTGTKIKPVFQVANAGMAIDVWPVAPISQ